MYRDFFFRTKEKGKTNIHNYNSGEISENKKDLSLYIAWVHYVSGKTSTE